MDRAGPGQRKRQVKSKKKEGKSINSPTISNVYQSQMFNLFTISTIALVSAAPMQVCPNGVCPKIAGLGKHCGGNMDTASKCGAGLVCQMGVMADVGGKCIAMADLTAAPLGGKCSAEAACFDTLICDSESSTCIQKINF
ncbi:hypothetical protein HDV01_002058 [Terramyces sp. JEL0728]|nr:hypothetical protein HDV01_002058 [Terramyces sp. JEL0728]